MARIQAKSQEYYRAKLSQRLPGQNRPRYKFHYPLRAHGPSGIYLQICKPPSGRFHPVRWVLLTAGLIMLVYPKLHGFFAGPYRPYESASAMPQDPGNVQETQGLNAAEAFNSHQTLARPIGLPKLDNA